MTRNHAQYATLKGRSNEKEEEEEEEYFFFENQFKSTSIEWHNNSII